MNFRLDKLAPIIGADEATLRDAARICGYRLVGGLLCVAGKLAVDFILEAQQIQAMKDAAARRQAEKRAAPD